MSLVIAVLVFLFILILFLPSYAILPIRNLHKLVILLNENSLAEKDDWTRLESVFNFAKTLFRLSHIKIKNNVYERYKRRLILADLYEKIPVECFIGLKILSALATLILVLVILLINTNFATFAVFITAPLIAYFCPDNFIYGRGEKRKLQIQIELPNILNTLAIITDSGLSFSEALKKVCEIKTGTLICEFKKVQKEIDVGELQKNALYKMAERCQLNEISVFVFAFVQNIEKGSSGITAFLKAQAMELWEKRKNKAREIGEKASMKLFLPMLLLVFPSFLIFIIGPAVIALIQNLSK